MNSLMEKILKNSTTKYTSILSESESFNNKDEIPTDLSVLNIAFSGELTGGMRSGLTTLAGSTKSYKTLLSLVCVRAYLTKYPEAICVFYDSEGGITPEYMKDQGVDINRVVHIPIEHLEMLKFDIVKQLKEINRGDKVIFVIDSIGNTASLKELNDALDEKTVVEMQRAKVIKGFFRMVTPSLVNKDIPCIAICHTYDSMDLYSKPIISGGAGILYSSNQAFIITKAQEKNTVGLLGWNFSINIEKSRFVREKAKLTFTVLYEGGIQKNSGLLELAVEAKTLHKATAQSYSIVDEDGIVEDKTYTVKKMDDEFWNKIKSNKNLQKYISSKFKLTNDYHIEPELEEVV